LCRHALPQCQGRCRHFDIQDNNDLDI
jgi:hypothetical protein